MSIFKELWTNKTLDEKITAAVNADVRALSGTSPSAEEFPEIPEFLRRRKDNTLSGAPIPDGSPLPSREKHPAFRHDSSSTEPVFDTAAARAEADRIKKDNALKKLRDRTTTRAAIAEGHVWRNGRFVHPDSITKAKYEYVLNTLPTPSMKRLFVHLYSERVL